MRLLILGMHRSGTSAVGRLLVALGVPTAPEPSLIGSDPTNPYGHYEVRALTDFNDLLLADLGGHWSGPPEVTREAVERLGEAGRADEARALLAEHLPDDGWFWKDPRLCVLLPFWRGLVEPYATVVVYRHPAEVAASLERRNGLPLGYGAILWERYMRDVLVHADGATSFVLGYEQLVADPAAAVDPLHAFLTEHGLVTGPVPEAAAAAVDPQVRHHRRSGDGALSDAQVELLDILDRLDGEGGHDFPALGAPTPGADAAIAVRAVDGPLIDAGMHAQDEIGALLKEVDRLEGDLAEAHSTAQAHVDRLQRELEGTRKRAQAEIDRLESEQRDLHTRAKALLAALHQERTTVSSLTDEVAHLRAAKAAAEVASAEAQAQATVLQQAIDTETSSTAYRAVRTLRSGVNKALPEGTRRRRAYTATVAGVVGAGQRLRSAGTVRSPALPAVVLADPPDPAAAVVIPVYGQRDTTHRCLESIARAGGTPMQRVVVVDDASPDDTPEYLAGCSGLHVVTNSSNQGFLRSTNAGVAASGDSPFVVLLNNDTEVTPGWLEALLAPFEDPSVGAVGAKLVYPDGRLQEAGSIVWRDGTGWNYGRGDDPARYPYGHVREVDYCSAACLAVRRDLWDRLGGFDERFVPAYYEDTDLCFAIRQAGYRVVYQPAAVVVHHEGVSHGTDTDTGGKANQVRNRDTFVAKWAPQLALQHPPDPANVGRASDRRTGPSVLVVDNQVPAPDRDSGSLRMSLILRMLVELGWRVRFLPMNRFVHPPYGERLQQMGIEVVHGPVENETYLDEIGTNLDLVVLSRPLVALNALQAVREGAHQAIVVYDMVDFHGLRAERGHSVGAHGGAADAAEAVSELECTLVRHTDATFAISERERDLVAALEPAARILTLPNVHDAPPSAAAFGERHGLLFVGSWHHPPNRDAIAHLVNDLMPLLRDELAGVELLIAGSDVPPDLGAAPDVRVLGWLPDLGQVFDRVRLSVAPLRYGAGLKGKVGDSLVRGVPVVTTSIGAEGFEPADDFGLVVADDPAGFCAAVAGLYRDEERWTACADAGRAAVLAAYGYDAVRDKLAGALAALVGER